MQPITFTNNAAQELSGILATQSYDRLFILCDTNTERHCLPQIPSTQCSTITIPAGDTHKNLDSLAHVWQTLVEGKATRHTLLINLGGGMVTDLGGFAAGTFKRGIPFINIPTTLLAMVDASVGGKTGINFFGLKNEIGIFRNAEHVIIDTNFLQTLDSNNILSGYAEMLKHTLLSTTEEWAELLNYDILEPDLNQLSRILCKNVKVKERIVLEDPTEHGLRKALNLGHTTGHALESFAMQQGKPVLHGYAVAWGIICELYLSAVKLSFPTDKLRQTVSYIRHHYGTPSLECKHYDRLLALMAHDKKNIGDTINFSLLADIGDLRLNQTATRNEICEALDFLREGL
ncbi:MAG: 3-dehydroquinate synthase [Bacteroidaceae bacterium]|nr:3-dehydroquinate synthase [Bacteroidaceae bacterium]MBP5731312.1 3-dehydroquinate synthase [Bacteroidaceae bacterium]